jgi:pimeloyl-ACP methyl ester carboxylesterase
MTQVNERWVSVELSGGKRAYGFFREVPGAPVVVMAHGLGTSFDHHPFPAASLALSDVGFSTFRFNFYDFALDARRLFDVTINSMADDLDAVIAHFRREHGAVSVIGHSMGGLVVLCSEQQAFDCAVTWDCGAPEQGNWKDFPQY